MLSPIRAKGITSAFPCRTTEPSKKTTNLYNPAPASPGTPHDSEPRKKITPRDVEASASPGCNLSVSCVSIVYRFLFFYRKRALLVVTGMEYHYAPSASHVPFPHISTRYPSFRNAHTPRWSRVREIHRKPALPPGPCSTPGVTSLSRPLPAAATKVPRRGRSARRRRRGASRSLPGAFKIGATGAARTQEVFARRRSRRSLRCSIDWTPIAMGYCLRKR